MKRKKITKTKFWINIWKTKFKSLLIILSLVMIASGGCTKTTEKAFQTNISKSKVAAYLINSWNKDVEGLCNYEIIASFLLGETEKAKLTSLIKKNQFEIPKAYKRSEFRPYYAFTTKLDNQEVCLLVCLFSQQIKLFKNESLIMQADIDNYKAQWVASLQGIYGELFESIDKPQFTNF